MDWGSSGRRFKSCQPDDEIFASEVVFRTESNGRRQALDLAAIFFVGGGLAGVSQ